MSDLLTALAVVGTAQSAAPSTVGDALADAILGGLAALPLEGRVLLAAGTRAVASFAGARTVAGVVLPAAAPDETRPACSPALDTLVANLIFEGERELLLEALGAIDRLGLRLSHARLVDAHAIREPEVRQAFAAVAGARGRWLGEVHAPCAWLARREARSLAAIATAFEGAKTSARAALLVEGRAVDAAVARGWLEAAWASEKADERAALLGALATGLSPDDETLLESALDDRSQAVRAQAAALLARLPPSAYVARQVARAEQSFALTVAASRSELVITWPAAWDRSDARDALVPSTSAGETARAAWSAALVAAVPLAWWTRRFALAPTALVAAGAQASGLIAGWARAALASGDVAWLVALVRFVRELPPKERDAAHLVRDLVAPALRKLPSAIASEEALAWLGDLSRPVEQEVLASVTRWSAPLSRAVLAHHRTAGFAAIAEPAARALDAGSFAAALALSLDEAVDAFRRRAFDRFQHVVRIRQTIALEPRALGDGRREEPAT